MKLRDHEITSERQSRGGHINTERLRCKYQYKQATRDAAVEDDKCWNDSLF